MGDIGKPLRKIEFEPMPDDIPDSSGEMYDLLWQAAGEARPSWRNLRTTHWVMNLEWYMAVRRAFLAPDAGGEARDEGTWAPDPGDMVLGYRITVTDDGGEPHLADDRTEDERKLYRPEAHP